MLELSRYILHAVYEATGQTGVPVDLVGTIRRRWPGLNVEDIRSHLGSLISQGFVAARPDGYGAITQHGIRTLATLAQSQQAAAQTPSGRPAPASAPPQGTPTSPWAQTIHGTQAASPRLLRLRQEIVGLTQELSSARDLPMTEWAKALEFMQRVDVAVDSLEQMLTTRT